MSRPSSVSVPMEAPASGRPSSSRSAGEQPVATCHFAIVSGDATFPHETTREPERSALVQGRRHLRAARHVVLRRNGDGVGDFQGLCEKLDYLEQLGVTCLWLLPFLPLTVEGRRLRYRRLYERPSALRHVEDFRTFVRRRARPRHARHYRAGPESHVRPAPVVPAGASGAARLARARLLRMERHRSEVQGREDHLHGHRALQLDVGSRC